MPRLLLTTRKITIKTTADIAASVSVIGCPKTCPTVPK